MRSVAYCLFLASGAAGLIYEVVWMRMLMRILGATVFAYTVVLSAFMLGLALGGWHFGRRIDRRGRPLLLYAALEAGIALWALGLLPLLGFMLHLFAVAARAFSDVPLLVDVTRCLFAFVALLVPTIFMGGTLPVLTKFLVSEHHQLGQKVALLYAVNTFGAILGAAAAGFVLIGKIGELRTVLVAVALNLTAAGLALLLTRIIRPAAGRLQPAGQPPAGGSPEPAPIPRGSQALLLLVVALTGFTMLAYEVLWTRTATLILHNTTYAFSLMLLAFLTGIALGSAIMAAIFRRWQPNWPARWRLFALLQFLIGLAALFSFGSTVPVTGLSYRVWVAVGGPLVEWVSGPVPAVFLLLAPLTLLSGASFPVAVSLHTRELAKVGGAVGAVYLFNTIGCALGSAVAGFFFLPRLGIAASFLICISINLLAAGAMILWLPVASFRARLRPAGAGAVLAGLSLLFVLGLTNGLDIPRTLLKKRLERPYQQNIFYREDINGIVSVWINPLEPDLWLNNKRLYIDGQPMASAFRYGMIYERLQAHYPLLLHPDPKDVLVICLGTGTTLGSAGQYPISRLDCVELSSSVVAAGDCFREETHNILDDPRLTVFIDDGRNYLLSTTNTYDVITAEPMHPHLAGTVNLYTREYFHLVRDRLRPGGICSHWIPLHRMQPREVKMAAQAFREAFPYTILFLETAEAIIIGSDQPLKIDLSRWRRFLQDPRTKADLEEVGLDGLPELLATYIMDDPALSRYLGDTPPVTDDRPALEFFGGFPRVDTHQPKNIREVLAHRDPLHLLRAKFVGELTPEEDDALTKLYRLEAVYLSAYADYVSGELRSAQEGFAAVLKEAPADRRAEISLNTARRRPKVYPSGSSLP